ncbi:MAG: YdeI/OmpD-associated family protein, partial [Chitinophagaceae bacterium]
ATILKFGSMGEKTGWSYIELPRDVVGRLIPGNKKAFRIKGFLDNFPFEQASTMPLGDGVFILAINAEMRKGTHKKEGATVQVRIELDTADFEIPEDFTEWLEAGDKAKAFFESIPKSHQRYWVNWLGATKTRTTRESRMSRAIVALSQGFGFAEMLRAEKEAKLRG